MYVIDRRGPDSHHKSIGQKERFLHRQRKPIQEAIAKRLGSSSSSVGDASAKKEDVDVHIPKKDLAEPVFQHGGGGRREAVHPGNTEYIKGDRIKRPDGSDGGKGAGAGAGDGLDSVDDFVFQTEVNKYLDELFKGRQLPNRQMTDDPDNMATKKKRDGYNNTGNPSNLAIIPTLIKAIGRRKVLGFPKKDELDTAQENLINAEVDGDENAIMEARAVVEKLQRKRRAVGFLDPTLDQRFRNFNPKPIPKDQVIAFLLLDASASMDEKRKAAAKTFFILYVRFLRYLNPEKDVVARFIPYTTVSAETDEKTFFTGTQTGGTIASSAFVEMDKIIDRDYANKNINIYVGHATDGDNSSPADSANVVTLLKKKLLPRIRHFAYVDVRPVKLTADSDLWKSFKELPDSFRHFVMQRIDDTEVAAMEAFKKFFPRLGEDAELAHRPSAKAAAWNVTHAHG